jgi:hypothetical protein
MVCVGLALLGSAMGARAWLTLSNPSDAQDSAVTGGTAAGVGTVSSALSVMDGAHASDYSTSERGYFPALKFALDLPEMLPDFPFGMLGEAPSADNLDWFNGGFVHDLPQSESETASGDETSSAGASMAIAFPAQQFSPLVPPGGFGNFSAPDSSSAVSVGQNVPEPGENALLAIGIAALLSRCVPRRLVPCREEVV